MLTEQEKETFEQHGYLIIRTALSVTETTALQDWANEVHDWQVKEDSSFMPYAEVNAEGKHVLSRTENFVDLHEGLSALLQGEKLLGFLRDLSGEDVVLFKEKINYKLAGSGGFAAHIDAGAYTQVKDVEHLTILVAIDAADMSNGCMEVVDGSHKLEVPIGSDNCIARDWTQEQHWTPVELDPGDVLIFGSYLAHRSGLNRSNQNRKALYATYNRSTEGDHRMEYYRQRRREFPPTHLRRPGDSFERGAFIHGNGTPMMSIDLGHQLTVS